ncbi:tyrosine-type recombinase/integrase [Bacillus andreraoultii]|uniref:tyrosine-type recombinase/integrase n=1 Tax=Bacillus andreraoultii TaxID=1499685 RepID=UPI000539C930|nr:tyrosine-type recombinase/integrase [Bacillus andreraoultii]
MEYVNPIKNIDKIQAMKRILRKTSLRDLLLFVIGINTGIKLQDLLHLKVNDVWEENEMKEFLFLQVEKDEEVKAYYLNGRIEEVLREYLAYHQLKPDDYLFKSKKNDQPITRQQAYRIINHAAKEAGILEKIGTHTLRKTFGYHAYRKGVAISIIKGLFNQHSTTETLKYIGINKSEKPIIKVDVNL